MFQSAVAAAQREENARRNAPPPPTGGVDGGLDCPPTCLPPAQRQPDNPAWDQAMSLMSGQMADNPNSDLAKSIRGLFGPCQGFRDCLFNDPVARQESGLIMMAMQFKTGAPWDHKGPLVNILRANGLQGYYFTIPGTDEKLNYDFWSNLHYGYVAASCGLSEDAVVNGAHAYQILSKIVEDNHWGPSKEAAIRAGARLWKQHPNSADMRDPKIILQVIRDNRNVFRQDHPDEPTYLIPAG
ncbi:hypothetical protein KUTG_00985 [Kutzneria sp. 744]|nr:hypothetical protein KUTG_00985 [Kutzneria sp. 744]